MSTFVSKCGNWINVIHHKLEHIMNLNSLYHPTQLVSEGLMCLLYLFQGVPQLIDLMGWYKVFKISSS